MITNSCIDVDGFARWPDSYVGAEEYYEIDCTDYLTNEGDSLVNVTWNVPSGLTGSDSYEAGNKAIIKIVHDTAGDYRIEFTLNSIEAGKTQKVKEIMRLVVS